MQNCKGQNDKKNQNISSSKQLEILNVSNILCGKNSSSQEDISQIKHWKLSKKDVLEIINHSEKINPTDLHYAYSNLPCEIEATIKSNGKMNKITINAGGYYYLDNDIYGCKTSKCYEFFPKIASQGDDAEDVKNESISNSSKIDKLWKGNYSVNVDYGKLDEFSEMSIGYDIGIYDNKCTFSGMGYKTYFTDECKAEEKNGVLIIRYIKSIEGDGFSDHSKIDTLAYLIKKDKKYYIKSSLVADENWKYNTPILIDKK